MKSNSKMKILKSDHENYLSLLSTSRKFSCCDLCYCDCCLDSVPLLQEPPPLPALPNKLKTRRRKGKKKSKRSKSANSNHFTRDCVALKSFYHDLPKTPRLPLIKNPSLNLSLQNIELCDSMQDLNLMSPKVKLKLFEDYNKIPIHDQKIINRMIRSRKEKAFLKENAWLAQKFYENEKLSRDLIKIEQEEEYRRAIKERQILDDEEKQERFNALIKRDENELKKLRQELDAKDIHVKYRLENVKLDKEIMLCQRKQLDLRKLDSVHLTQEELNINDELRRQQISNDLEDRLSKAECIRQQSVDAYVRRLKYDNYMEQVLHEENFREVENLDNFKKVELKHQIEKKQNRTDRFMQERRNNYEYLLERAKISASLRDIVRRSVSPDAFQFYSVRGLPIYDRPISNLSSKSCIRLG